MLIEYKADVLSVDNSGNCALHFACGWGGMSVALLLVENGADINVEENTHKLTPLEAAAVADDEDFKVAIVVSVKLSQCCEGD